MLLIDKFSGKPVYEQIVEGIERHILLGVYPVGGAVPSVRELSASLGINPNTIQKSYVELTRRGVICPSPGSGCYVTPYAAEKIRERARERLKELEALSAELILSGLEEEEILEDVRRGISQRSGQGGH